MNTTLLWLSVAIMLFTAAMHSVFGERRLIMPLLDLNQGVMANPQSRAVMRLAWHGTSILMVGLAYVLAFQALNIEQAQRPVILAIGFAMTSFGLLDAVISKGRHIGWPFLTAVGVLALLAIR